MQQFPTRLHAHSFIASRSPALQLRLQTRHFVLQKIMAILPPHLPRHSRIHRLRRTSNRKRQRLARTNHRHQTSIRAPYFSRSRCRRHNQFFRPQSRNHPSARLHLQFARKNLQLPIRPRYRINPRYTPLQTHTLRLHAYARRCSQSHPRPVRQIELSTTSQSLEPRTRKQIPGTGMIRAVNPDHPSRPGNRRSIRRRKRFHSSRIRNQYAAPRNQGS